MSFPASPVDGQRYTDYTYDTTIGAWLKTPVGSILGTSKQADNVDREFTNVHPTYVDSLAWDPIICKGKSELDGFLKIAGRNDLATSWGGIYTKLWYRIDDGSGYGSYIELFNGGFDLSMVQSGSSIDSKIYPFRMDFSSTSTPFTIQFKTQHAVYSSGSTARISGGNSVSGDQASLLVTTEIAA